MGYPIHHVPAGDVLPIFFSTYSKSAGASITMSDLAVTDIEIYKDGSTTQRASDAGYTLLDTDGIDFDGLTGIHGFSIDTGDDTDAGFYTVGAWFHVVVSSVTIDGETVSFIAAAFRIVPAESSAGAPKVDVSHAAGTAWASGAIVNATFANDAITAAKLAADVGAEIADAVWDESLGGHLGSGSTGEALDDAASGSGGGASQASVDAIQSDVNDIYSRLGAPAGASMSADIAAIEGQTDDIGAAGAGLSAVPWNAAWDAQVESEVADALLALFSAARAEPAQGAPSASATALEKLDFLYKLARNKLTQDGTTLKVFADDGSTVDHKATVSDTGTLYTRGEIVSGP